MSMFYVNDFISHLTLKRLVKFLHEEYSGDRLLLYINSQGGCTRSAFAIYEILRTLSEQKNIEVVAQAFDECYSAALILFLAADERYATKYSTFLIHEVSIEESTGKHAEGYKNTAVQLEKETSILYDLIVKRTNLSAATIKKKVKAAKDNDWLFDMDEAEKYGIVTNPGFYIPEFVEQDIEMEEE